MDLPTLYLPVDSTGVALSNKIEKEAHSIESRSTRVLKPNFGLYYTESFQIWSVAGQGDKAVKTLLKHGVDYSFVEFFERLTRLSGKEICGAVLIHREELPDTFEITYQALGGKESVDHQALAQAVGALSHSGDSLDWDDILDKPTQFPPAAHLHDSQDVYGLEYMIASVRELLYAVTIGSDEAMRTLLTEALKSRSSVLESLQAFWAAMDAHFYNQNNPHNTTKSQVGLEFVENRHFVKKTVGGVVVEPYASPRTTFNIIKNALLGDILKHIDDKRNPHAVTAEQVGFSVLPNYGPGTTEMIVLGQDNTHFVSPKMVADALPSLMGGILSHVVKKDNPHAVTAAQVGLGKVNNFPIAGDTDMDAGISTERHVVPTGIKRVTNGFIASGTGLADHTTKENPHDTTKEQVGLGNVNNYGTADESNVLIGLATDLYVTPKALKDAIYNGFDSKMNVSQVDAPNGAVPLGADRLVPGRLLENTPDYRQFSFKNYFAGSPEKDQMLFQRVFTRPVTFTANFVGSLIVSKSPSPINPITIEILKGENTVVAQIVFNSTKDVGVSQAVKGQILSNGEAVSFSTGEVISFRCTASDAEFKDISVDLQGTYNLASSSNPMGGLMPSVTVRTAPKVIFGGGRDASDVLVNHVSSYRMSDGSRVSYAGIANARHYACSFGNSAKGYIVGGKVGDTGINTGGERHLYSDSSILALTALLGVARWSPIGFGNENTAMVIGGITASDSITTATTRYIYSSDIWGTVSSLGLALSRSAGYGNSQYGYIRNGSSIFLEYNGSTYFGKYNYAAQTLNAITTSSTLSRYSHSCAGNKTIGLIVGGYYQGNALVTVQRHSYASDTLSVGSSLGDARAFGAAGGDDVKGVFAGGQRSSGAVVDSATIYTYADDTTAAGTALDAARQHFSALSTSPGWR